MLYKIHTHNIYMNTYLPINCRRNILLACKNIWPYFSSAVFFSPSKDYQHSKIKHLCKKERDRILWTYLTVDMVWPMTEQIIAKPWFWPNWSTVLNVSPACVCPGLHNVQWWTWNKIQTFHQETPNRDSTHDGGHHFCMKMKTYEGLMLWVFRGSSDSSYYSALLVTILFWNSGISLCNLHFTYIPLHSAVVRKPLSAFWFVVQEIDSHRMDNSDLAFIWTCTYVFPFFFFLKRKVLMHMQ